MKKLLAIALAIVMTVALCACTVTVNVTTDDAVAEESAPVAAEGAVVVTLINGMDGSTFGTYEIAAGEDFVFTISCAAPCDMGPCAEGEEGSGVSTTSGTITYSNITTGGPNSYPTAETVTISGISADCTITITPNPDETDAEFPSVTVGEAAATSSTGDASEEPAGDASGETSEEPAGDASDETSEEPAGDASEESSAPAGDEEFPLFDEYKQYLYDTLMQDSFWQGNEGNLTSALDTATSPNDESIQNFTGSGTVDQAPEGVSFPQTYDAWYAENA